VDRPTLARRFVSLVLSIGCATFAARDTPSRGAMGAAMGADVDGERARVCARARRVSAPEAMARDAARGVALFSELRASDRAAVCARAVEVTYVSGEEVVRRGEVGGYFYVVAVGCVRVEVGDGGDESGAGAVAVAVAGGVGRALRGHVAVGGAGVSDVVDGGHDVLLYPGETFGEVALVCKCPRTATVKAASPVVKLWALDRATFHETLKRTTFERRREYLTYLDAVPLFRDSLDARTTSMLVDALRKTTFEDGETIVRPSDAYDDAFSKFYVIIDGTATVHVENDTYANDSTRQSGRDQEVNRLTKGDYFGEVSLIHKTSPTATVVARGVVTALTLDAESFHRMISGDVMETMSERVNSYAYAPNKVERKPKRQLTRGGSFAALRGAVTSRLRWLSFDRKNSSRKRSLSSAWHVDGDSTSTRSHREDLPKIHVKSKNDVMFLKEIGGGMLGAVFLAKTLNTRTTCCVKVMQKWKVVHLEQENNVSRELDLMKRFDSPFLTRAMGAFQDERSLYLVMEYFCGGDLFQLLVNGPYKGGKFPVQVAEFYAAEVLMALQYIHEREYVYRDLKPENVLIDSRGHAKLTDLGFCRRLLRGERAYTTCGTADYMAPEVMLAQGYDQAADYWSFGVLVYEMLVGYAPFASVSDGDRHRRIVTSDLRFHAQYFPLTAKSLIARLCVVDVARRLGSSARGIEDLKSHAFFTVDWADVASRQLVPPYVPEHNKTEDTFTHNDSTVARHQSRELLKQLDRRGERERCEMGAGFPANQTDAFTGF